MPRLERHDLLRYKWLGASQSSYPFIRLMYADSPPMMRNFSNLFLEKPYIHEERQLAFIKTAYRLCCDLYNRDASASRFQLSIQMRLCICQCSLLVENPDWLERMGILFQRILPIVFRSWPTLMGKLGELLARGAGGVQADPEQALQIYKLHNDYYIKAL